MSDTDVLRTIQWIAIVGGTALLIYVYYRGLERLGNWLEARLQRKADEAEREFVSRSIAVASKKRHGRSAPRVWRRP